MRALTQYSCYAATTHLAVKTLMLSIFTVAYIMPECFAAAREQRCRDIARDSDTPAALIVSRCSLVMSVGWTSFGIFTGEGVESKLLSEMEPFVTFIREFTII